MRNKRTVFIGLLTLLLVISVAIFAYAIKKTRDVEIVSRDEKAVIILDNAANSQKRYMENIVRRRFSARNNIFEGSIHNNEAYLYSVEEDGSRSQNETGKYLLYKNHRYFLIDRSDYDNEDGSQSNLYYYTELLVNTWRTSDRGKDLDNNVFLPVLIKKSCVESNDPVFFKWSDTVGLTSFEDLKEYYKRIEEDFYSIEEENKCIVLNGFNKSVKSAAKLYATDEGITLVIGEKSEYPKDASRTITYINGELVSDTGDPVGADFED